MPPPFLVLEKGKALTPSLPATDSIGPELFKAKEVPLLKQEKREEDTLLGTRMERVYSAAIADSDSAF